MPKVNPKKYNLDAYSKFKQRGRKYGYSKAAIELRWTKYKRGMGTVAKLLPAPPPSKRK